MPTETPSKLTPAPGSLEEMLKGTTRAQLEDLGRASSGQLSQVPVEDLEPNPWQYRSADQEWVEELAESIAAKGLLEAITYRTSAEGKKQIISGHTRWAAVKFLRETAASDAEKRRHSTILANEKLHVSDVRMEEFGIIDNLFRKDPSLVDTARALAGYQERAKLSLEQLAERFNLAPDRVRRMITLSRAPEVVKAGITKGVMVQLHDEDGQALVTAKGRAKREHRQLDLMAALELSALFNFLETKVDGERAAKRVEALVTSALERGWTFRAVQDACQKEREKVRSRATADADGQDTTAPPETGASRPLFRTSERELTVYRSRLATAEASQKGELRGLLAELVRALG